MTTTLTKRRGIGREAGNYQDKATFIDTEKQRQTEKVSFFFLREKQNIMCKISKLTLLPSRTLLIESFIFERFLSGNTHL